MIWGLEGRHIWTPPGGKPLIRRNAATNPRSNTVKMLTSSSAYTTSRVEAIANGLTTPPHGGTWCDKSVFASAVDSNLGFVSFNFPQAGYWLVSLYVWLPATWDGGSLALIPEGYTGATLLQLREASATTFASWQRLVCAIRVESTDLTGNLVIRTPKNPTVGRSAFVSSALWERAPAPDPIKASVPSYFPTRAQIEAKEVVWEGTEDASPSQVKGNPATLGDVYDDTGIMVWPHYRLKAISGLFNIGDGQDNADLPPGRLGEIARLSQRRGKAITYEGWIEARSLRQLREADTRLRQAFAKQDLEGRMEITHHPLNLDFPGENNKYFEARPLGVEVVDVQDTMRYQRRFLVALRAHDPRTFDVVPESHSLTVSENGTEYHFV